MNTSSKETIYMKKTSHITHYRNFYDKLFSVLLRHKQVSSDTLPRCLCSDGSYISFNFHWSNSHFYGGSYLLLDPSHRIPAFVLRLLWIIYFLVMFLLLFFRVYQDNNIKLNLLKPFNFETTNLSQVTLNLILFIPIGYWLNWFKISSALLISLLLITFIEILQLLIHHGIFDVVDILINTIGIMIGYIIFKTFNIKLH